jgi:hypothetical protein
MTHEFEAPQRDRRTPIIEEIGVMADWYEKNAKRIIEARRSDDLSKLWLVTVLQIRFRKLGGEGGKGSWALHRFIANASAPVLTPDKRLTPGAVRDLLRDKKPKRSGGKKRKK